MLGDVLALRILGSKFLYHRDAIVDYQLEHIQLLVLFDQLLKNVRLVLLHLLEHHESLD